MRKPFGMAPPVHMYNDVTLNQFRPYEDSDETHYWIDIHGVRVSLTKSQFIAMHDARIQLWDTATKHSEERIIKLLETTCDCAFYEKYGIPSKCHAHKHIALIKGEK